MLWWQHVLLAFDRAPVANYSVKWTAAAHHGTLTLTVAAATYLKR